MQVLGVVENMSGLQQRLPHVRFELEHPSAGPGGGAGAAAAVGDGLGLREDITSRIVAMLQQELGLSAAEAAGRLVVCTDVFEGGGGGAERMCREMGVKLLGRVPMDPALGRAAEAGRSIFAAPAVDDVAGTAAVTLRPPPPLCQAALMAIVDAVLQGLHG